MMVVFESQEIRVKSQDKSTLMFQCFLILINVPVQASALELYLGERGRSPVWYLSVDA
jgi:hypothetical protein